jgi:protein-L-isoaspartate(D-aspartate) O-methyltransferase
MIKSQLYTGGISDKKILEAMAKFPRNLFVTGNQANVAYVDRDIPVSDGRYILSPITFAQMIDAAQIQPTDNVLEIASTTGYSTAVLSELAANIVAIEESNDLSSIAHHQLNTLGIKNVITLNGNFRDGHSDGAPYDIIFINGTINEPSQALLDQISDNGGRLITIMYTSSNVEYIVLFKKTDGVLSQHIITNASANFLESFAN